MTEGRIVKYIIDRIEGNYAVCEDENKRIVDISLESIQAMAKEGMSLTIVDDTYIWVKQSQEENEKRKRKIDQLWK